MKRFTVLSRQVRRGKRFRRDIVRLNKYYYEPKYNTYYKVYAVTKDKREPDEPHANIFIGLLYKLYGELHTKISTWDFFYQKVITKQIVKCSRLKGVLELGE